MSVIIPTLGEAGELAATLDSVVAALGSSAEIIVADAGSDDGTTEVAREAALVVESTPGRGRQQNAGVECSEGAILLFLHADTWLSLDAGTALAEAVARPEVIGGCFSLSLRGPSARRPIARGLALAINLRSRWFRTATGDQAIFARRSAFQQVGGFKDHDLFEDVIFYRRLRRLGKVVVLKSPVLTSDRRWRKSGYLRTIATHLALRFLFLLGVSPARLAALYRQAP